MIKCQPYFDRTMIRSPKAIESDLEEIMGDLSRTIEPKIPDIRKGSALIDDALKAKIFPELSAETKEGLNQIALR